MTHESDLDYFCTAAIRKNLINYSRPITSNLDTVWSIANIEIFVPSVVLNLGR